MTTPSAPIATPAWPTVAVGYSHVPAGHLASVVTYLEMHERPAQWASPPSASPEPPGDASLVRLGATDVSAYRALFAEVGAPWLWFSRLTMDDAALRRILEDPAVQAYAVETPNAGRIGLLELDFREPGACELAFVGLRASHVGQGVGRWLMAQAMALAWSAPGVTRVHVHTCTFDHPGALAYYVRSGFAVVGRAIEVAPDPRVLGLLPESAAPHVPLARL